MATNPLPLSIIADVTVITAAPQVSAPPFNIGLVVGPSTAIPSYGVNPVIRKYLQATWSTAMQADGFTTSSPEYIAVQIYFSQSPPPQAVYVGRQDGSAISAAIPHTGNAGTGYVVGDLVTVVQSGASFGQLRVATIGGGGAVTALTTVLGLQGTGYSVATGLATTGGTGASLEVDITTIGQSALQAVQLCRQVNPNWYCCMVTDAVDADHIAIAAWVQTQIGTTYFGTTGDANVLNGVANNVCKTIFAAGNGRTWMQYATTQSGLVPNQAYFVAAVMGQAMASNTQAPNSAFTEKFSGGVALVGVVTEPGLTITQIGNIEGTTPGQGPNCNLFLNYSNAFNVLEQGTMMAESVFFDQVLNLDILAANIQFAIMNLLTSVPKIPQTDQGQQQLIQAVEQALSRSASTGFIAPGTWEGQAITTSGGSIVPGQNLPNGFAVVSPKYSSLTQSQIQARQAPPIYVALIEAGAVHFVTISVLVQV
jgi:hypothetical protein